DASAKGKTVIMVGTKKSRPFVLAEAVRTAKALGVDLYLVDDLAHRGHSKDLIPDSHFIAAPITDRDPEAVEAMAKAVAAHPAAAKAHAVAGYFSSYAKVTARITDLVGKAGIPGRAVSASDDKVATREVLNAHKDLEVPSRAVTSAEDARKAYADLGGGKFIMKTIRGENSRFLAIDLDSPEKVEKAYREMDEAVKAFAARPESKTTTFSNHPGILLERMLEKVPGTDETSVEVVMQNGKAAFALVSDTLNIGPNKELAAGSITFPSQAPAAMQAAIVAAAAKALNVIGITDGNARVDMMLTPDGPKVVEINPYMGGVNIFLAIKSLTGMSLVEQGFRAILGLRVDPGHAADGVIDYRFLASKHSGAVESVAGMEQAAASEGVEYAELFVEPGDTVVETGKNSYEEYGEFIVKGKTFADALSRTIQAVKNIVIGVKKADGTVATMVGDHAQPTAPSMSPGLFSKVVLGFLSTFILVSTVVESTSLAVSQMTSPLTQGFLALAALTSISYAAYTAGSFLGGRWVDRFGISKSYRAVLAFRTVVWTAMAAFFFATGTVPLWALVPLFSLDYFAHSIGRIAEHKLQVTWFKASPTESSRFGSFRDFVEYGTVFVASGMGLAVAAWGFGAVIYPAPVAFGVAALIALVLRLPGAPREATKAINWSAGFRSVFSNNGILKPMAGYMLINSFLYMLYYIVATAFGAYVAGVPEQAAAVSGSLTGLYGVGALLGALAMDRLATKLEKDTAHLPEGERTGAQRKLYLASAIRSLKWAALAVLGAWAFASQTSLFTFGWPFFIVSPALIAIGFTAQRALIHLDTIMKDNIPSADESLSGSILGAIRSMTYLSLVFGFLLWGGFFALLGTGAFYAFGAFYTA
ncbi:MAG: cysteine synthase A, partial [Elusimicrobia bacterium]